MADARSEQIMSAVETALAGLTTTGANVQRGQVYPHQAADLPALGIMTGDDVPAAEYQTARLDWLLTVIVEAVAGIDADYTTQASTIESTLAQIRKEVHIALFADHTLGLSFVLDIQPGAVGQPLLDREGQIPLGSLTMLFVVNYRTSRTDISA